MGTKAQDIYEAVNALVDSGIATSDAFRQVAAAQGVRFDSARGSYYTHKRQLEGGGATRSRSRKRETTTADAVASAVATLRSAIDSIEFELEAARERAEEASAEYEAMQAASGGRVEEIRAKIAILDPEADDQSPAAAASEPDAQAAAKPAAKKAAARKEAAGS